MNFFKRIIKKRSIEEPSILEGGLSYIVLGVWAFICMFPIYWVMVTSFKEPHVVNQGPFYIPFWDFQPSLHAWEFVFLQESMNTLRPFFNTVIISLISAFITLLIGSMAGYALVRIHYRPKIVSIACFILILILAIFLITRMGLDWRMVLTSGTAIFLLFIFTLSRKFKASLGNNDIGFWMISQRILPPVVVVIPVYIFYQQLGILDTYLAMVITYVAINIPIVVWLMRDFFFSIPVDLEENAALDGASRYRIFTTIVLPLTKPGLSATFMLVLILCWNEYLLSLFISMTDTQTLPLMIASMNTTRGPQWWYMSVIIILMIIPVIMIALFLYRFIVRGLLVGAIKG
ncbi:MAG TPA: carbohydrate ABC transporter permease [Candidatus Marinimicrobia bacterium]|nr:carbohydrate ABC transporter permease [Candidatus Neomarinimicrobiota bacterium]|tara:strand:+ start:2203 stop:3240 length:1038 start_codon:yes stop_codon:yes gene_type:complete